jgi:hypothetical protein
MTAVLAPINLPKDRTYQARHDVVCKSGNISVQARDVAWLA